MYELALFAGAGGGLLATKWLLGWRTVCYVENAAYPVEVLKARIGDGYLDDAPIWDDVRTFRRDNPECGEFVERLAGLDNLVITGGFPCQPFSSSGKQLGEQDERNRWPDTIRIIREIRPQYVFLENVPGLISSGYFGTIIGDLTASGYDARWRVLSAAQLGAPHIRKRLWILAYPTGQRCQEGDVYPSTVKKTCSQANNFETWWGERTIRTHLYGVRRIPNFEFYRMDKWSPPELDRLKALGNGQVPLVATVAWRMLSNE